MTNPRRPDLDGRQAPTPYDSSLDAIAAAILDGADIDWGTASVSDSIAAFAKELRLVADIASVHRSLSDDEGEALRFPPEFPWPVGKLILTASLGRGIYGEVFRAWDNELHRDVAVKLLFGGRQRGEGAARALDEGRLLARVRHPNVVAVHAVERIDGRVGLVTEYVKGQTLAEIVRESGAFSAAQVASIGIDLCRALDAVHGAGLLHRDIKAQNVMREATGRVVLMDFGAGLAGEPAAVLAGTPLYLAPEVLEGGVASRRSDIYSVGVLLHYLLTAAFPVSGASLADIRDAHARGDRVLLRDAAPQTPRALAAAIDAATDPDPARRYDTAAAFAHALERASAPAPRRRHVAIAAVAAVALTVAGGALWGGLRRAPVPAAATASDVAARVTVPPYYEFGGPSFDGRYMVHLDLKQEAWLTQIDTGHTRRILEGDAPTGLPHWATLSSDGTRVAYTWIHDDGRVELRVVDAEDRWPGSLGARRDSFLLMAAAEPTYLVPVGWSRDGTKLAIMSHRADGPADLIVAAQDGTTSRVVHTFTGPRPRRISFSGDGRFLAFDQPNWPSPERDIHIVPSDGSREPALLIGGDANDELPMWSADGGSLIFNSDRNGSTNLWRVPIANGSLAGRPVLIATDTHAVSPVAVTASGDYHYTLQTKHEQLFTVALDERGVAAGAPVPVPGDIGLSRTSPAWSPDGGTLAYFIARGMNLYDFGSFLALRDAEGRTVRDIGLPLIYFGGGMVRWAPNGQSLLVRGKATNGHWGFHRIDPRTGDASTLVRAEPQGREDHLGISPGWGRQGRTLVWTRFGVGIVERSLATGVERVILPAVAGEHVNAVSPSRRGDLVAFTKVVSTGGKPAGSVLGVVREDGTTTELVRKAGAGPIVFADWAPDDAAVVYAEVLPNGDRRLRRVSLTGGEPVDMGVTIDPGRIRISHRPDGRALTYASGTTAFEIWVMRGIAR